MGVHIPPAVVLTYVQCLHRPPHLISMQHNNSTENVSSTNQELVTIYKAMGIANLVIVVVPTLVLACIVLYYLCMLMKTSGVKPISLLFFFLAILCMLGPLSYGILWDISLITAIPVFGNCTAPNRVFVIQYIFQFGIGMAISITISMIAVLQFLVLQCGRAIMVKHVVAVYLGMMIISFSFSCIFFNGGYTEIRGSHCKAFQDSGTVNVAVWTSLAYAVPMVVTVMFSVLTCLKVKKDVLDENGSIIRSVVIINTFNIFAYIVLRVGSLLVYFTVVSIKPTKNTIYLWTTISRYIGLLNYPLTMFSILIVHSSIRKMILSSAKAYVFPTPASSSTVLGSIASIQK